MKVKTLVAFKDLKANETRIVGEIFEADKKRCEELMNKKLVQVLNDNKKMKKMISKMKAMNNDFIK